MERLDIFFKTATAATGGIIGYLFGGWSILLQILLAFVIIDYITGLIASGVEGKLNSRVGFRGIAKKLMIFILVAVGHLVDEAIGEGNIVQNIIIFFYLGNELLSIIENAGRTGLPIPVQLKNAVQILQGKSEQK